MVCACQPCIVKGIKIKRQEGQGWGAHISSLHGPVSGWSVPVVCFWKSLNTRVLYPFWLSLMYTVLVINVKGSQETFLLQMFWTKGFLAGTVQTNTYRRNCLENTVRAGGGLYFLPTPPSNISGLINGMPTSILVTGYHQNTQPMLTVNW